MDTSVNLKKTMNILEFLDLQSGNRPKPTLKNSSKSRKKPASDIEYKISGFLKPSAFENTISIKNTSLFNSPKALSQNRKPKHATKIDQHVDQKALAKTQIVNKLASNPNNHFKTEAFYSAHSSQSRPKKSAPRNDLMFQSLNNSFEESHLGNSFRVSLEEKNHRKQNVLDLENDDTSTKFSRKPTEKKIRQYANEVLKQHAQPKATLLSTAIKAKVQRTKHSNSPNIDAFNKHELITNVKTGIYYTISCLRYTPQMNIEDIKVEGYLSKLHHEYSACNKLVGLLRAPDKTILLPEKRDKHTPTIIIDLFNTLIKCKVKTEKNGPASLVIKRRPFLRFFLSEISSRAELVVFSSSNSKLVQQVLDEIDPTRKFFTNVLTKEHCTPIHGT
jgi:hypothetical protein